MSNALYTAVTSVLTGPNYLEWAVTMESYLLAQGQWKVINESRPATDTDKQAVWDELNGKAMGNLRLRLAQSIISAIAGKTTAADIWNHLKTNYGKPGIPIVY